MQCKCGHDLKRESFKADFQDEFVEVTVKCSACGEAYYTFVASADFKIDGNE